MSYIHTIFGAGQIGIHLARLLAARSFDVRLVRRGAPGPAIEGVTWWQGDVTNEAFARAATQDAQVVYNCTNPSRYHGWAEVLPPLFTAVRMAATRAGARLVVLDNLYMYGRPGDAPFDERTPLRPCSRKGELRARLVGELFDAYDRGDVEVTTGRASDFFGPATPNAAVFRPDFYRALARGGTAWVAGDPDQSHSYNYTPDVARGLAVLGTHDRAVGRAWHLPVAASLSTRALMTRFGEIAGRGITVRRIPQWVLRALGVAIPVARAVAEMTYQWDTPFILDDSDFRSAFGVHATPLDSAIAASLAHYQVPSALRIDRSSSAQPRSDRVWA